MARATDCAMLCARVGDVLGAAATAELTAVVLPKPPPSTLEEARMAGEVRVVGKAFFF